MSDGPTVADQMPEHDRARMILGGLLGANHARYLKDERFKYAVDYINELARALADEVAAQDVPYVPEAMHALAQRVMDAPARGDAMERLARAALRGARPPS